MSQLGKSDVALFVFAARHGNHPHFGWPSSLLGLGTQHATTVPNTTCRESCVVDCTVCHVPTSPGGSNSGAE